MLRRGAVESKAIPRPCSDEQVLPPLVMNRSFHCQSPEARHSADPLRPIPGELSDMCGACGAAGPQRMQRAEGSGDVLRVNDMPMIYAIAIVVTCLLNEM